MTHRIKSSPVPFLLGTFLLLLLTALLWHDLAGLRANPQASLVFSEATKCSTEQSRSAQMTAFPRNAVQLSAQPALATWRDLGEVHFRPCAEGKVTLHLLGHPVGGWGPTLRIVVNNQTFEETEIIGDQSLSIPVKSNDRVRLILLNYIRQAKQNYLTLQTQGGPWCESSPPLRQGAAWIQPGGQYGDITGAGQLTFTACKEGKASFQFTRKASEAGVLKLLITQNATVVFDGALSASRTMSFSLQAKDTLTIRAPEAKNQVTAERYLELKSIAFP